MRVRIKNDTHTVSFIVNKIVRVQAVKARGERRNNSSHSLNGALECETSEQRRKRTLMVCLLKLWSKHVMRNVESVW